MDKAIGQVPLLGAAATISSLYSNNVSKERVAQGVQQLRDYADEFDRSDFGQRLIQEDLRESARNWEVGDPLLCSLDEGKGIRLRVFKAKK